VGGAIGTAHLFQVMPGAEGWPGAGEDGDFDRRVGLDGGERRFERGHHRHGKCVAGLGPAEGGPGEALGIFAEQVSTVAREVGIEGKLGGQAKVPGAAGPWKGLTENVNQLAANLPTQLRAIADGATAATQRDLTRSRTVAAQGEAGAPAAIPRRPRGPGPRPGW